MRVDNINLFGAGSGTGTIATSSFSATASLATSSSWAATASFVGGTAWTVVTSIDIGGYSSNPTKASSRTVDHIRYRQVANKEYEVEMQYSAPNNTGATAGTGFYLFSLPGGLQFNSTYHPSFTGNIAQITDGSILGARAFLEGSSGFIGNGSVTGIIVARVYDSTRFVIGNHTSFGGSLAVNTAIGQNYLALNTAQLAFTMRFTFTAA